MRSMRSFPLHKLRIIKRRFNQKLDEHLLAALKNLKKHSIAHSLNPTLISFFFHVSDC